MLSDHSLKLLIHPKPSPWTKASLPTKDSSIPHPQKIPAFPTSPAFFINSIIKSQPILSQITHIPPPFPTQYISGTTISDHTLLTLSDTLTNIRALGQLALGFG